MSREHVRDNIIVKSFAPTRVLLVLLASMVLLLPVACGRSEQGGGTTYVFDPSLPPIPIEETGNVKTLPNTYPESWMFVDEANFPNMFSGKVIVLDVAETHHPDRIKGIIDKNLLGNFVAAKQRPELYISETFHERGARGARTDILAIYDKRTLAPIKEMVWPSDRLTALPERYAMSLSADERFLFVSNFTPAASFGVVDLNTHTLVEIIETPGCVLVYPTGQHNLTSICSNGTLLTTSLTPQGRKQSQQRTAPFFDADKTPVFERPAIINNIAYFPSFDGLIHVVDLSANVARYIEKWDMLSEKERASGWRPGGLEIADHDDQERLYVIMHENAYDGSHNHGGSEVWVYDVRKKRRIKIIKTPSWAISIALSRGANPLLVVTNGELNLDVFDAQSGQYVHTLSDFGNVTPLLVHKTY